jgi:cytochrome c oxidase subunit 2
MTVRGTPRIKLIALCGGLALALSACARTNLPQDTLNPAGHVARTEAHLYWVVFIIATIVFILVEGLLVLALVRFRHRPGARVPVQIHGNRRLEIGWTILPALLLAAIAIPTVGTIFALAARPANPLEITVTGHQWWWEVQYPTLSITTANEIHIPAGRNVYVTIKSVDVIHSFWVPRLAGKQDLEPGRTNHLTIEADQPGVYLGQCAEFCGTSHANMRFRVIAQSGADFQTWAANEVQDAAAATTGSLAAQGQDLFQNGTFLNGQQCVGCHTVKGLQGAAGIIGPNLTHFGSRTTFAGATYGNTPSNVGKWLYDPAALKPGVDMPNLLLTQEQINALVAYLESLK